MFNDIVIDIDGNITVILLLLDLSAAFDTVDHSILLNRWVNHFGICSSAYVWFQSCLRDRFHFVSTWGAQSATCPLLCRVPQRPVLGSMLYLLYTTLQGDIVRRYNMGFHCCADDTQFYDMANPVLGKSLCSDWFFLGQDFAVWTSEAGKFKICNQNGKKNCEYCHSSR